MGLVDMADELFYTDAEIDEAIRIVQSVAFDSRYSGAVDQPDVQAIITLDGLFMKWEFKEQ